MLRSQPTSLAEMAWVSGVARKLALRAMPSRRALGGEVEALKVVADVRHELITLARAGMTPLQIAGQLQCSENVYTMLAEAIGKQQLSLEQALDLPGRMMGEVQECSLMVRGEAAQ